MLLCCPAEYDSCTQKVPPSTTNEIRYGLEGVVPITLLLIVMVQATVCTQGREGAQNAVAVGLCHKPYSNLVPMMI